MPTYTEDEYKQILQGEYNAEYHIHNGCHYQEPTYWIELLFVAVFLVLVAITAIIALVVLI